MATKQVQKVVIRISCPTCKKFFKMLKSLPCHHPYCEKCLEKMKAESRPRCRKEVKLLVCGSNGSPYSTVASHDYTSLHKASKIMNNDGRMGRPWGIGFYKNGNWAVADHYNHCVYLYDAEDQFASVRKIGNFRHNSGQFNCPRRVTFDDDDDHLYIADHCRVQKFTIDGDYLLQLRKYGSNDGEIKFPDGLAIHNGKVYVADYGNKHISVFLTDGTFQKTIGRGQLGYPCDVAVTSNDKLLLVDSDHNCIYRFTLDGNYVDKFSNDADKSFSLRSITVDSNDFILMTDTHNHEVVIFNIFGNLVHKFGCRGSGGGEFLYPRGIAVNNKNGDIYVSDFLNKRIQVFSNYKC